MAEGQPPAISIADRLFYLPYCCGEPITVPPIELEIMPREPLEAIQLRRRQATLERVYASVSFYRQQFQEAGIVPADIQKLDGLATIPLPTKQDLRGSYPFLGFAAPMDNIVRIHASSGTAGQPTGVGYTARDIATWPTRMARSLAAGGASRGRHHPQRQRVWPVYRRCGRSLPSRAMRRIGDCGSGANTKRPVVIMKDFGPTILTATPFHPLHLAEVAEERGVSFDALQFQVKIFGAEAWSEPMREEIERQLKRVAEDFYGLSEVMGPGVAIECHEEKKRAARIRGSFHSGNCRSQHARTVALRQHR